MLPEGWKEITFSEAIKYSAFGPRFSAALYDATGNVGVIRTTDIDDNGHINYKTVPLANVPKSLFSHTLEDGDLLITRSGTCGIVSIFHTQDMPIIAGAFLIRLKIKPYFNNEYIARLLMSPSLQKKIERISSGGVQKNISGTNLGKLKIIVPPLPEQEKIAAILSTWDKAISTADALLENSRQQKKALMQQLLTGKRRLPGFKGEWKQVKLEKIAQIEKGKPLNGNNIKKGPYPVIAGGKTISAWHKDFTHENVVTVSASGAYAGFVSFHNCKIWASDCTVITNINNISYCRYLYYALLSRQDEVYKLQTGGAQPHVYPKDLASLGSILPPLDEQRAIAAVLDAADREITLLEQKAARLREEKKALMQQLLTGKRRVRV